MVPEYLHTEGYDSIAVFPDGHLSVLRLRKCIVDRRVYLNLTESARLLRGRSSTVDREPMPGVGHEAWPGSITDAVAAHPDHGCSDANVIMPPGQARYWRGS